MFEFLLKNFKMFLEFLKKLKLNLSKKYIKSPTINSNIKNKDGYTQTNSQVNSGDYSPSYMAGGDINISYAQDENAIENEAAWENLLNFFGEKDTLKIINEIKDPCWQQFFQHNLKGKKDFITSLFKACRIPFQRKKELHQRTIKAIDSFVATKNEEDFKQSFKFLYQDLIAFKASTKQQ